MDQSNFLVQAAIYMAAAVITVPLCKRFGLGSVLGYLLAGIIIGPHALSLIHDPEHVLHFAEFGVMLLLFLVGIELEPEKVWGLRKTLFGLGGMQVVLTICVVFSIACLLGFSWQIALVIGMGITMSSTAIALATLEEKNLLRTPGGQSSFAILLFQDLSVVPLFMLLAFIAPQKNTSGFDFMTVLKAICVIVAIIVISRTILRPIMRMMAQTQLREIFLSFSFLLMIGVSIAVESVGLSMALGTFLAGVMLADSEYRHQLRVDIEPAKGLLLGLFFIAVGMSVDLNLVMQQPWLIIGLALLLVAIKISVLLGLGRLIKLPFRETLLMAIALSQIGEFAFVIFRLALTQGSIANDTYNMLNAIVAISMLLTPLLFVIYDYFVKKQFHTAQERDLIEESNSVIIAGFGRFGQMIGRILMARDISITLIDSDPNQVELVRKFKWRCYYGNASHLDLLEEAGMANAQLFVIAVDDPEAAFKMAVLVRQHWPHVKIVARARSRTDAFELRELDLHPIRETFYSALHAAEQALLILGVAPKIAKKIVSNFEQHDLEQIEKTLAIRNDRAAILDAATEGRENLKNILSSESILEEEEEKTII